MKRIVLSFLLMTSLSGVVGGPAKAANYVGYVGCSQALNAVEGYQLVGGKRFWPLLPEYGGGTVINWANGIGKNDHRWVAFKGQLAARPPSQIWVQWCTKALESYEESVVAAPKVIAEIRRLAPNARIFVSAQNGYWLPHFCSISGLNGPLRMQLLALLTRTGLALPGPDVGMLKSKYQQKSIPAGDQTVPDGCHANTRGKTQVLGPRLKLFFG
jgi:hypothetical protein